MHVVFPMVGDSVGGSHHSAFSLIAALKRKGVEVSVVVHCMTPDFQSFCELNRIDVIVLNLPAFPVRFNPVQMTRSLFGCLRVAPELLKDVDIIHGNDARINNLWVMIAKMLGKKYVWHQRNVLRASLISRILMPFAARVISISSYVDNTLSLPSTKSAVVYNPVQVETVVRGSLRNELKLHKNTIIVGGVGSAIQQRNVDLFFELAQRMSLKHPELAFVWVGRDVESRIANILASVNGLSQCFYLGYRPDVHTLMADFDVLIAPAVREGFGRTLVEAMLVSVPVIASNTGGHLEVVEHNVNGLLFESGHIDSLEDQLRSVLANKPLRESLTRNALLSVGKFGVGHHLAAILDIYQSLVHSGATRET